VRGCVLGNRYLLVRRVPDDLCWSVSVIDGSDTRWAWPARPSAALGRPRGGGIPLSPRRLVGPSNEPVRCVDHRAHLARIATSARRPNQLEPQLTALGLIDPPRFRKPLLYPLSYEGARPQRTCQHVSTGAGECPRMATASTYPVHRAAEHPTSTRPHMTNTDAVESRRVSAATKE
jgi:hypothetical protein